MDIFPKRRHFDQSGHTGFLLTGGQDWILVDFGQFFENHRISPQCGQLFNVAKACINLDKKWIGLRFGRLFHKIIWQPWPAYPPPSDSDSLQSLR
jgi:hypothetical protein